MTQDELAVMDGGKCIFMLRGVRPFLSDICQHSGIRSFERLAKEDGAEDKGENLRDREAEPHELQFPGLRKQPRRR